MKLNLLIALVILSVGGMRCTDSSTSAGRLNDQLTGTWEWTKTTGGIAGVTLTPESEGYTMTVVFTPTGRFERWRSGKLVDQDLYSVVTIKTGTRDVPCVDYASTSISPDEEISFDGNSKLILADRYMDGFTEVYTKIH